MFQKYRCRVRNLNNIVGDTWVEKNKSLSATVVIGRINEKNPEIQQQFENNVKEKLLEKPKRDLLEQLNS